MFNKNNKYLNTMNIILIVLIILSFGYAIMTNIALSVGYNIGESVGGDFGIWYYLMDISDENMAIKITNTMRAYGIGTLSLIWLFIVNKTTTK